MVWPIIFNEIIEFCETERWSGIPRPRSSETCNALCRRFRFFTGGALGAAARVVAAGFGHVFFWLAKYSCVNSLS